MELKSKIADMSNMGNSRNGGATIGGKFLEVFVDNTPWVHLDIAGTTDLGDGPRGSAQVTAAGRIVHTLTQLALTI
jgi:leucyl aminopeptidase